MVAVEKDPRLRPDALKEAMGEIAYNSRERNPRFIVLSVSYEPPEGPVRQKIKRVLGWYPQFGTLAWGLRGRETIIRE